MCAHYFGFTEFIKLDSDILAEMQEKIDELMEKSEDEVLDQADLENVQNTQFRLSAIYDLCYMLREYTQSINKRFDEIISRSA